MSQCSEGQASVGKAYDTDEARDFRRGWIRKVRPKAAEELQDEVSFRRTFRLYKVVERARMPDIECKHHIMFCPACVQPYNPEMVRARQLHVKYEKDPLGNFAMLANLRCMGCDWTEIVPVDTKPDTFTEAELRQAVQMMEEQDKRRHEQMKLFNSQVWSDQIMRQYANDSMIRQMANSQAQALANKIDDSIVDALVSPRILFKYGQKIADEVWKELDHNHHNRLMDAAHAKIFASSPAKPVSNPAAVQAPDSELVKAKEKLLESIWVDEHQDKAFEKTRKTYLEALANHLGLGKLFK